MNNTPDNNNIPPDLEQTQHALRALAQQDRDAMPDSLIDAIAARVPTAVTRNPFLAHRARSILAIAAILTLLLTTFVLLQPTTPAPNDPDEDWIASLELDSTFFEDDFDSSLESLETDLLATQQLYNSWTPAQLWDDSQNLFQEVVQ
jgi:hypothetical protein